MTFLQSWIIIAFYSLACIGFGEAARGLVDILLRTRSKSAQRASVGQNIIVQYSGSLIVGVAMFGILWTFIALPGLLSPQVIAGVQLPFFLYGCWRVVRDRPLLWHDIQRTAVAIWRVGWLYKLIAIAGLYAIFVIISSNLNVYPGDATAYYFALAKVIASSHTLKVLPGYYFGTFPSEAIMGLGLHGELHMAAIFSLGANHFARYFDVILLIVGIVVLLGFSAMAGVKTRGLLMAVLMVLLSTAVIYITAIGKVDIYGVTFTLGAIYFAGLYFVSQEDRSALVMSGILIGTAVTTKFSYLVNMLPAIAVLLFWNSVIVPCKENPRQFWAGLRQHYRPILSALLILGCAILLSMVSYFVKNQVVLGFFLAPFFIPKNVLQAITVLFPDSTVWKFVLTYPFTLSYFDIPQNAGHFPPLLWALFPNLYFARKCLCFKSLGAASFFAGLVGIFLWILFFPGVPFVRYIFAALLLLLPLVLYATEYVLDRVSIGSLRLAIQSSLLISAVFGLLNPAFIDNQFNLIAAHRNRTISRCSFPQCQQDEAINKDAAPGDRLLNLSDFRFWLRSDLIECAATTQETLDIISAPKDQFWASVYQRGIKYVSLNLPSKGLEDPRALPVPTWLKVSEIYRNQDAQLIVYRLDPTAVTDQPLKRCVQKRVPDWEVKDQH